jgi:Family of unknown function (DUF6279)
MWTLMTKRGPDRSATMTKTNAGMEKNSSTQDRRPRDTTRFASFTLAIAIALLTTACGGLVKIGYRNGDTIGMFMIDRYLDLSGDQKEYVKPKLHQLLAWHRTTQLPDYVTLAEELQRKAPRPITLGEVDALSEQSRRRVMTTIYQAIPELADVALRLTPDNIKALQKKFAEDDDKWRDENMKGDIDKQKVARYERTLERVEEWYGRFGREQRATIRQLSDARPLDNDIVFAERQRREQGLVALLTKVERDKPSRDAVLTMMRTYADNFERNPDPDRRAFLESLRQASEEMNAAIQNLSTPQQRANAVKQLQVYIDDFKSLASDPS